jgi:excinuclease ABC subunit C
LNLLLRSFPIRTCSDSKLASHQKLGRPCLLFHIEKCSGPCVGEVSKDTYSGLVKDLSDFLDGDTDPVVKRLEATMTNAAQVQEFEKAARIRDRLVSVRRAIDKQQLVAEKTDDLDAIGIWDDDLEAMVQVFHVRNGRVVGRNGRTIDKVEDLTRGELVGQILEQIYADEPAAGYPKLILVPDLPPDPDIYEEYLALLRADARPATGVKAALRVEIRVPERGEKREFLETVTNNAKEEFVRHRLKRASDHNARAKALNELQDYLGLEESPLRIECYDNSHIQGSDYVSSMVVFEDGLANKREYRRFKVRAGQGNDDFAAMEEVLTRRLSAYVKDRDLPIEQRGKFKYPPNLLVIDGGKGQLTSAMKVLSELGLEEEIAVCSLAKQFEEVFVPYRDDPIRIPRQSEALYLLQRLRDEAHRFAITFHRELRGKRMTASALDGVAGLGKVRRERLLDQLGGMSGVRQATKVELRAITWLPETVADAVFDQLHP